MGGRERGITVGSRYSPVEKTVYLGAREKEKKSHYDFAKGPRPSASMRNAWVV